MTKKPNIRFKGFDQEWKEKPLDEMGDTYTGLSGKNKNDFGHGDGRYITYMNVFTNPVASPDDVGQIEIDNSQNQVKKGDILFTTSSETPDEVGMSSVWLEDKPNIYLNSFCFGYRPSVEIDPYFSAFLMRSPKIRENFYRLAQGISRFNISKQKAMEMGVQIPDPAEQSKIGEFFKALDELIGAKEEELEKLRQLKAALLEQMFPSSESDNPNRGGYNCLNNNYLDKFDMVISSAPNTPRIRFKGFSGPWERKTLDELFTLRNGYTPSKANPAYWTNGTIPWFRMDDIREQGHILKDASQHITPEAVKGSGLFPAGCIIMSTTATIGEHALIIADSLANQRFTVLQTANRWETLDMMYFYHYCFILGDWCRKNVNVGGLNAVNISDMKQHKIPFPSMEEQKMIASLLTAQEDKLKENTQQVIKLKIIKQALLEKMFAA